MLLRAASGQAEARAVEVAAGTTPDTGGTVVDTPDTARMAVVAGTTEMWPAVAAWIG